MSERPFPARFRRRLAVIFVLVAGASAGALAVGAIVTSDRYRVDGFESRAHANVRRDVRLLAAGASAEVVAARLADREEPGGPGVIVVQGDAVVSSVESLTVDDVPATMRDAVRVDPGAVVAGDTDLDGGGSTLVLGTIEESTGVELYFFFPRRALLESLRDLRTTLVVGWVVVVVIAAVAGTLVARRTLRPVRSAADAARSVAEGLLDTRLPVDAQDEFGEWAMSFNRMVSALEEKILALAAASERERRFTADVAHELRTPLSAVLAAASHLEERADLPTDLAEVSGLLAGAARRLDRLTSELLELHRLEGGQADLHVEAVDVEAAIAGATAAHGWSDRVRIDVRDRVVLDTDRRRLDRIVVNLVGNALEHGGTDAVVSIGVEGPDAVVAVADSGPGIAPEDLPHVFERHFKGSRTRTASSGAGSGLGLSIVQESAQLLGGRVDVRSTPGDGATFVLRLPLQGDEGDGHDEEPDGEGREPGPRDERPAREPERHLAQRGIGERE